MCSICGISFQKNNKIVNSTMICKILQNLLINCQARGRSATGVAIANNKRIVVIKNNLSAEKFVKTSQFKKFLEQYLCFDQEKHNDPLIQIIGHCRMPTKGTPLNNKNNHPIVTKSFVGVHNGVIFNDDQLFDDYKNDFERDGEVDSEIIFKLIEKYYIDYKNMPKAIQSANSELSGGMACAFVTSKNPYLLWLFRHASPVSILHYKKVGMIIFASDEKYITNATRKMSIGTASRISIQLHEGLGIDLFRNTMHHFKVPEFSGGRVGFV
jgi:glucosamine 6-phosphate synthetase-like amidotransferase/phosphosugar isomerase protein